MASSILLPTCAITVVLLFISPAATFAATVLDVEGNPIENEGVYYILPRGPYGLSGLTLTPVNNSSPCPLSIKQQLYTLGLPATISSIAEEPVQIITTGLPISPYYTHIDTACNEELRWWVTQEDENHNRFVIVGVKGSGKFEVTYFFNIEEANDKYVYNIKFCHILKSRIYRSLTNIDEECNEVGLINGLLGLTNKPFDVVFMKNVAQDLVA